MEIFSLFDFLNMNTFMGLYMPVLNIETDRSKYVKDYMYSDNQKTLK